MRDTMSSGTGQAVFVPGEWRSLASGLGLSPRECGIVRAVFDGDSEKRTAERLGLSPHTVHTYLWRIYRKLSVASCAPCSTATPRSEPPSGSDSRRIRCTPICGEFIAS